MKKEMRIAAVAAVVVLCGAGYSQTNFYLLPDADGHVGQVTVTNKVGSATLTKANETVGALGKDKAFSESRQATSEEIETKFKAALAAMPAPPKSFIVYFDSGSCNLKSESKAVLAQVVAEVRQRASHNISLNGHTDRTGDPASNMELSRKRANTVTDLLAKEGIKPESITMEYYGESKPVVPTKENVSEPKNRRVEVVIR